MKEPVVWPGHGPDNDLEQWKEIMGDEERDETVPCPDCGNLYLYTNVYDKCYNCGRGILEPMET